MDSVNSFKGYGKVDPIEDRSFRRKTRRHIIIVSVSSILLLAVIAAVVGTVVQNRRSSSGSAPYTSPTSAIRAVCGVTQYPDSCFSSIQSSAATSESDPEKLFALSLHVALNELSAISSFPQNITSEINDERVKSAMAVCQVMIEDAIERLNDSIASVDVSSASELTSTARIDDLKTWLSSAITDQETCMDALWEVNSTVSDSVLEGVTRIMKNTTEFTSNSLAIATKVIEVMSDLKFPTHRKLLEEVDSTLPKWIRRADRRLLEENKSDVPDVTVAKDGSGDFKTINEALSKVPKKSKKRFVICVKAGVYTENVEMDKYLQNVMIYGDGMYKTIVSGSKNYVDHTPTFRTATFAVVGKGFIAKDMGFRNTAGAIKHQAVALRSGSDLSVFQRCSFNGYQDTLYPHSNRQFYRDCDITGTVDFIFGNAAVVFQNCNILPRQPMPGQFVTITAQGKKDINQNTGISIEKSVISPLDDLTAKTYLGRPWKSYSTTIIKETNIGSFLDQSGWISFQSNVDPPETILYGEYRNTGPGSSVDKRVTWPGYKPNISTKQALKFSVSSFLDGEAWIPGTGVDFN